MPALVLLMLHLFGVLSLFSGDGGSGSGDAGGGAGQGGGTGDGAGGGDDDGDDDDDDADDEGDSSKLLALVKKLRSQVRSQRKDLKGLSKFKEDADAERRKVEEQQAKDQGKFQELAEKRQAEIDRLKGELTQRDRAALRAKVAAKHQLPDDLAELLQGDDEAALEKHAAKLAKVVGRQAPVDTDAGQRNQGDGKGGGGKAQDPPRPYRFQGTNEVKW